MTPTVPGPGIQSRITSRTEGGRYPSGMLEGVVAVPPPEGPSLANRVKRWRGAWFRAGPAMETLTYLGSDCPINWAAVRKEVGELDTGGRQQCPHKSGDR